MNLTLAETGAAAAPFDRAAVAAEVGAQLGPAHATLFALPVPDSGKLVWQTQGNDLRRFVDLAAEDRRALLAAAGSILSDIRRLAESGRAPALVAAWPTVRGVPGTGALFAVDGRPVLAPWGVPGEADLFAAYDDGIAWVPKPRTPWAPVAAALASVALLALAAGLLLPAWGRWAQPAPAMCQLDPAESELMRRGAQADSRANELKRLLASLNDEIGRRQLLCPLPVAQAPAPPQPAPPPPAPPPPHAELPADRWNEHDLSLLDGCWHSTTQMITRNEATNEVQNVREWRLCFDTSGHGRQTIIWNGGRTCTGPLAASFDNSNQLTFTDVTNCRAPGTTLRRGIMQCRRVSDAAADCTRMDTEGPAAGLRQPGRFVR